MAWHEQACVYAVKLVGAVAAVRSASERYSRQVHSHLTCLSSPALNK